MDPELLGNILLQALIAFNSAPKEEKDRFWSIAAKVQAKLDALDARVHDLTAQAAS